MENSKLVGVVHRATPNELGDLKCRRPRQFGTPRASLFFKQPAGVKRSVDGRTELKLDRRIERDDSGDGTVLIRIGIIGECADTRRARGE